MSISVVFHPANDTVEMHHRVLSLLREVGQGNPDGRQHHQALAPNGMIDVVVDIWESPEQLQAFATHLMPILVEVGITPPQPDIDDTVLLD